MLHQFWSSDPTKLIDFKEKGTMADFSKFLVRGQGSPMDRPPGGGV